MFYGTQKLFCPVHPKDEGFLGNRKKEIPSWFKCEECQFYFYFPANATVPTKVSKSNPVFRAGLRKYCGPEGCFCRD